MELHPRVPAEQIKVETLTPQDYLIHVEESDESVSIGLHLPENFGDLFPSSSGEQIAEATIVFLLDRQRAYHLPADIDLDDIEAAYDDFAEIVKGFLSTP